MLADARSPAVEAAQRAFVDAEADAAAASAAVDEARERFAMNRAKRGDVIKAQRRLAASVETREQARAAVRAVERAAAELRNAAAIEHEEQRRQQALELRAERDDLAAELGELLADFAAHLADVDHRIVNWTSRALGVRSTSGPGPGQAASAIGDGGPIRAAPGWPPDLDAFHPAPAHPKGDTR